MEECNWSSDFDSLFNTIDLKALEVKKIAIQSLKS